MTVPRNTHYDYEALGKSKGPLGVEGYYKLVRVCSDCRGHILPKECREATLKGLENRLTKDLTGEVISFASCTCVSPKCGREMLKYAYYANELCYNSTDGWDYEDFKKENQFIEITESWFCEKWAIKNVERWTVYDDPQQSTYGYASTTSFSKDHPFELDFKYVAPGSTVRLIVTAVTEKEMNEAIACSPGRLADLESKKSEAAKRRNAMLEEIRRLDVLKQDVKTVSVQIAQLDAQIQEVRDIRAARSA